MAARNWYLTLLNTNFLGSSFTVRLPDGILLWDMISELFDRIKVFAISSPFVSIFTNNWFQTVSNVHFSQQILNLHVKLFIVICPLPALTTESHDGWIGALAHGTFLIVCTRCDRSTD